MKNTATCQGKTIMAPLIFAFKTTARQSLEHKNKQQTTTPIVKP
jgi:hypothetical protein